MPFKPGQSGNPAGGDGRKPSTRERATAARDKLWKYIPDITNAVIQKAVDGDIAAARLILDRVIPPLKPEMRTVKLIALDDPTEQAAIILSAALSGRISPDSADSLISTLLTKARLTEVSELVERVAHLQKTLDEIREKVK